MDCLTHILSCCLGSRISRRSSQQASAHTPFPSSFLTTPESPNNPKKSPVLLLNYPQLHSQHQFNQFPPLPLMLELVDLPSLSCSKLPMHPPETHARPAFPLPLLQLPQSPQDFVPQHELTLQGREDDGQLFQIKHLPFSFLPS